MPLAVWQSRIAACTRSSMGSLGIRAMRPHWTAPPQSVPATGSGREVRSGAWRVSRFTISLCCVEATGVHVELAIGNCPPEARPGCEGGGGEGGVVQLARDSTIFISL